MKFPRYKDAQRGRSIGQFEFIAGRRCHDLSYATDAARLLSEIGCKPSVDFNTVIRNTLKCYLERQNWWLPRMDVAA